MNSQLEEMKYTKLAKADIVYSFIISYMLENSLVPTYEEIREGCELSSKSMVSFYLDELVRQGLLSREAGQPRTIQVPGMLYVMSPGVALESGLDGEYPDRIFFAQSEPKRVRNGR